MTAYNSLARHILAPTLDVLRGTHVVRYFRELEASQWWSKEELQELQSTRLREIVQHSYEHVPYYRQIMDTRGLKPSDVRRATDLTNLPVLTKDLVRANLRRLVADNVPSRKLLLSRTGGSTGSPLAFYTTADDWFSHGRARGLIAMDWADIHMGDRTVSFPAGFGLPTRKERALRPLIQRLRRSREIDVKSISDDSLPDIIEAIRRIRPRALIAYPTVLALLAQYIKETDKAAPPVHAVLTGGEQMFPHQRSLVRDVFGHEPFSRYGSHENYLLGTECDQHQGFHMFVQDLVVEVVDDSGMPLPSGQEGHVLVTNLHARGMPFIRYDTGDIASWVAESCSCGRSMPLLNNLVGRSCDVIITPSGKRVAGTAIGLSRMALLGVWRLQIVQETLDSVHVRLVVRSDADDHEKEKVRAGVVSILERSLGADMSIEVAFVDHIEPTPAGKHVPVVSRLSGRLQQGHIA